MYVSPNKLPTTILLVVHALALYTPKVLRMQVSKALRRTAHRSCALRTFEYTL